MSNFWSLPNLRYQYHYTAYSTSILGSSSPSSNLKLGLFLCTLVLLWQGRLLSSVSGEGRLTMERVGL